MKPVSETATEVQPATETEAIPTSLSHRGYALVGPSFVVFEVFFLSLNLTTAWFDHDIRPFGIPAVLLAMVIGHLTLRMLETDTACRLFSFVLKGRPAAVYTRFVTIRRKDQPALEFGLKRVVMDAIDELELTFLGNLVVRSKSVCGKEQKRGDIVLKMPFSVTTTANQKKLIRAITHANPEVKLNKRLEKCLNQPDIKGAVWIQTLGVVFLGLVLLDLGNSTFAHLEMVKEYYLAEIALKDKETEEAKKHFDAAEDLRLHPFPLSWIENKVMTQDAIASGTYRLRADVLWGLGRKEEALKDAESACAMSKKSSRMHLQLARMLTDMGRKQEAREHIRKAIDLNKDSLLPRLYMVAVLRGANAKNEQSRRFYDLYRGQLNDEVYREEPAWPPPASNSFTHEFWYSDDLDFVFERLIK